MNDFYDVGVHDDKFVLLSKMNEECKVCVKTLVGVTDQLILKNIEMQGTSTRQSVMLCILDPTVKNVQS